MKIIRLMLTLLIGAACMSSHADQAEAALDSQDTISVVGHGEVSSQPDQALISLTISAMHREVKKAKIEADRKYQTVAAAIKQHGIDERDVKLSTLNIFPEYQWQNNSQSFKGIRVSRTLTVTVDNLDLVPSLMQSLVETQVSTINGVQTSIKNRSGLEREALKAAIADAKEKAEFLATQFGKTLGDAHSISEFNQSQPIRPQPEGMVADMASMSAASTLPAEHFGTQTVQARIMVVFHTD